MTVDGTPIAATTSVEFVSPGTIFDSGVNTVDCSSILALEDQTVVVRDATLTLDLAGCAPLRLKSLIVQAGGVVTHSPAAVSTGEQLIDIIADDIVVEFAGAIDVSAKGYPALTWFVFQSWPSTSTYGGSHGCGCPL